VRVVRIGWATVTGALCLTAALLGCGSSGLDESKVRSVLDGLPYAISLTEPEPGVLVGKADGHNGASVDFAVRLCDGKCDDSAGLSIFVPVPPGTTGDAVTGGSNWAYLGNGGFVSGQSRRQGKASRKIDARIYVALCRAADDPGSCV